MMITYMSKFIKADEESDKIREQAMEELQKQVADLQSQLKMYSQAGVKMEKIKQIEVKEINEGLEEVLVQQVESVRGFDSLYLACPRGHKCQKHSGKVVNYRGEANCDHCNVKDLQKHKEFYRCDECKHDVCLLCALQKCDPPMLNEIEQLSQNGKQVTLKRKDEKNGWNCDGIKLFGKCESGLTDFYQSDNTQRYSENNLDVCIKCLLKSK